MTTRELLIEGRRLVSQSDWDSPEFDPKKALGLAMLSAVSYRYTVPGESSSLGRALLVPCEAYRAAAASGAGFDFPDAVKQADVPHFVLRTRRTVAVGIAVGELWVVAVRGSKYFYDWRANFRVCKSPGPWPDGPGRLHAGFLREARILTMRLRGAMAGKSVRKVVFTGHSLGGAIAGLLYGGVYDLRWWRRGLPEAAGCYAFGAPRWAGLETLAMMEQPYCVVNEGDLVPRLPPGILGYDDAAYERGVDGQEREGGAEAARAAWAWLRNRAWVLSSHDIETYLRGLGRSAGVKVD